MIVHTPQVESFFKDPDNVHKLYIYEIVNFDNDTESIVAANTNNFLKLKYHSTKTGLFDSVGFSPQIKILSDANDMSLKINTDYRFITNEDLSILERTNKTYLFTINSAFDTNSIVYFLSENSMRVINEIDGVDADQISTDSNLTNLYSISLQNIHKMSAGKNSTINFMLVDDLPKIKKIESIEYEIPINTFYQTIQVVGDLKNDDLGETLLNEKIDLELSETNGIIPVTCRLTNCNVRAEVEVLNFSLPKQLPLNTLNSIVNRGSSLFSIFDNIKIDNQPTNFLVELKKLLKTLILVSYAYTKNFDWFDKNNNNFVNYFNATFANKTLLEYSNGLIYDFESSFPTAMESQVYKLFRAICYSMSHRLLTPFGHSETLTNTHKDLLWVYLEVNNTSSEMQNTFNSNGSFKTNEFDNFEPYVIIESKFFNIVRNATIFSLKAKTFEYSQLGDKLYLPNSIQNEPNDNYYQLFLFTSNWSQAIEIMQNYSTSTALIPITRTVFIQKETNNITIEELKAKLPIDAIDVELVGNIETEEMNGEKILLDCPPAETNTNYTHCDENYCYYFRSGSGYEEPFSIPRPFYHKKLYKFTATFNYKTRESEFWEIFSFSSARIFDILFRITSQKTVKLNFKLAKRLAEKNWYITNIKYDQHYALLNSNMHTMINYLDSKNQIGKYKYDKIKSFQKLDNRIPMTKNQY